MAEIPGPYRINLGLALAAFLLTACEEVVEGVDDNKDRIRQYVEDGTVTVYQRDF